jgi:hypothetical protein
MPQTGEIKPMADSSNKCNFNLRLHLLIELADQMAVWAV